MGPTAHFTPLPSDPLERLGLHLKHQYFKQSLQMGVQ